MPLGRLPRIPSNFELTAESASIWANLYMSRLPFPWIAAAFTAGTLLYPFYQRDIFWPLFLVHFPLLFFIRGRKLFIPFFASGLFLCGILFGNLDHCPAPTPLENALNGQDLSKRISVTGTVESDCEIKEQGNKRSASFVLKSESLYSQNPQVTRYKKIPASGRIQIFLNQPIDIPQPGDTVRIWGQIERPKELLNPGGFNYRHYLKLRDIHFTLTTFGGRSMKILKPSAPLYPPKLLSRTRQSIRDRINYLFKREDALLVRALILGDRKNFRGKILDDFLKSGTSHLLAISGLNISLVAGSFYLIMIVSGVSQKKSAALALLLAVFQVALAGFGIPVQRAGIMAGLGFFALILERERSGMNLFALAFFVLMLGDTRSLESISFQLSFLSLFCLILFSHLWNKRWPWLEPWAASAAVLAGTFPIVLYHFSTFSPISILANILGIPLFHFVLLTAFFTLTLGGIPILGPAASSLCEIFIRLSLSWIQVCAAPRWGYFYFRPPGTLMILFYYLAAGILLSVLIVPRFKHFLWKLFASVPYAAALYLIFQPAPAQAFKAVFFSAGANEIAHLDFGGDNHWLMNAGRTLPGDQVNWIVAPYLRSRGIKHLTGIIFTDESKRHTAGLESIQRDFSLAYQILPENQKQGSDLIEAGKSIRRLRREDKILMPNGAVIEILGSANHQMSFRIDAHGVRILILPRISYSVLKELLKSSDPRADILMLPADARQDLSALKAILTLSKAKLAITPGATEERSRILQQKRVRIFDLTKAGAVTVQTKRSPGAGFTAETFIPGSMI